MKSILPIIFILLPLLNYSQYPMVMSELNRYYNGHSGGYYQDYTDAVLELGDSCLVSHWKKIDTLYVGNYRLPNNNEVLEFQGMSYGYPCQLRIRIDKQRNLYKFRFVYKPYETIIHYLWTTLEKDLTWSRNVENPK